MTRLEDVMEFNVVSLDSILMHDFPLLEYYVVIHSLVNVADNLAVFRCDQLHEGRFVTEEILTLV